MVNSSCLSEVCSALIYCFSDVRLKSVCGVSGGGAEVVIKNEILYLGLILDCGNNDDGIAFICSPYHSVFIVQFFLDRSYCLFFWVCSMVGVVLV